MRWFDGEVPINTYYQYRNGFLERIVIRPEETGYTSEEVRGLIEAMYGAPEREEDGQASWPTRYTASTSPSPLTRRAVWSPWAATAGHHQRARLLPGERRPGRHL